MMLNTRPRSVHGRFHRRYVSEKTLELNVSGEILVAIRRLRGFECSFLIGMTQLQEARNGIDARVRGGTSGRYWAFQFKSPEPPRTGRVPVAGCEYYFRLNETQHDLLTRLARRSPLAVRYALPYLNTDAGLRAASPQLLRSTRLVPVAWVPPGHHWIERDGAGGWWACSDRTHIDTEDSEHFLRSIQSEQPVTGSAVLEWLGLVAEMPGPQRGQVLRGLVLMEADGVERP